MRLLTLASALFALALAGCSSSDPDDGGGGNAACRSGLSSQGSFTATVGTAAFEADCFDVQIREITVPGGTADVLTVTGSVLGSGTESLGIVTGAVSTGVYSIQDRAVTATAAEAAYVVGNSTRLAESGTVTITQYSDSRVGGELDIVLDDATTVTGEFDITY